jgi:hypothetical protein
MSQSVDAFTHRDDSTKANRDQHTCWGAVGGELFASDDERDKGW